MTFGRLIHGFAITFVGVFFLVASANAQFSPRIEDFEETVWAELANLSISQSDVVDLRVYPHFDRRNLVNRATGWVRLQQCPEGWIVVRMSAFATVTYTYVHGECEVIGLN